MLGRKGRAQEKLEECLRDGGGQRLKEVTVSGQSEGQKASGAHIACGGGLCAADVQRVHERLQRESAPGDDQVDVN